MKAAAIGTIAVALCAPLFAADADKADRPDATRKEPRIAAFQPPTLDSEPLSVGSRRELFVDNFIIGALSGGAVRHLFAMTPATTRPTDVAMTWNADWEGFWCRYSRYIEDHGVIKAWYMGHGHDEPRGRLCFASSDDGRSFVKPDLGLYDWKGSRSNNVLFDDQTFRAANGRWLITHNFVPFVDTNPAASPEARYKGVSGLGEGLGGNTGLYALKSADGIRWELASEGPIASNKHRLDSTNQGFWDGERKRYAVYFRHLRNSEGVEGYPVPGWRRDIRVTFSDDFIHWTEPQWLVYHRDDGRPGMDLEHLYTNEIKPYKRAPHLYLGFPARFHGWVEPMLMASRDGVHFYRWMEHPLIPRTAPADRDKIRSNHLWQEMVEIPGEPDTYSMYASENLGITGPHSDGSFPRVRRFTIRKDGFVSVRAEAREGALITKPLTFDGERLTVNYNAKLNTGGSVRVEILDKEQRPIPAFTAADCDPLSGDQIDAGVTWNGKSDVRSLEGKPIHLRFVLNDADLFSFRFTE
jgi:hypothetical protein